MPTATKILFFSFFLLAYVVWLIAVRKLQMAMLKPQNSALSQMRRNELSLVIALSGFFACIYLLSGFFKVQIVLLFVLVGQIGILVQFVAQVFLKHTMSDILSIGTEFGIKHPLMVVATLGYSALMGFAYPIAVGVIYFRHDASPDLTLQIIRYTFSILFAAGLSAYFVLIYALSSKNIDERSRVALLTAQLSTMFQTALFLCLIFLTFSGRIDALYSNWRGAVPPEVWIPVLLAVIGLFAATAVVPYFVGAHRANMWRQELLQKLRGWIAKIEERLDFPSRDDYAAELRRIHGAMAEDASQFVASDRFLELTQNLTASESNPQLSSILELYRDRRDRDSRIRYLDTLKVLSDDLDRATREFNRQTTAEGLDRLAVWVSGMLRRRDEQLKELQAAEKGTSPITKLAIPAVSLVSSAILTGVGKSVWEVMAPYVFTHH